ncbi:unnamed protein product, partial [Closterium sp. NIES-64]
MAEVDVAGLSAGTTHTGVTGGGSVPTARRYSLGIVQPGGAGGDAGGAKVLSSKSELKDALTAFQQTFVMCDATKPDNPIMFAISKAEVAEVAELRAGRGQGKAVAEWWWGELVRTALDLPHSILPRYPPLFPPTAPLSLPCPFPSARSHSRFLQGEETDKAEIAKLRAAVAAGESWCGRLLNYKKDGSPFWNLLTVSPVKDDNGTVVKFIGMQVEVTKYTEGAKDKETRPNALPVSLIKYDAGGGGGNKSLQAEGGEAEGGTQPPKAEGEGSGGAAVGADGKGSERRKSGLMSLLSKKEGAEPAMEALEEDEGGHKARRDGGLTNHDSHIFPPPPCPSARFQQEGAIFASDDFLELTEYSREEILGRNCRFLQGPDTDPKTVQRIRDAIKKEEDITVQLLNYTKSGKQFWNLFHLQAVRDNKGMLQYFIGVQLDASHMLQYLIGVQLDASQCVDPSIHPCRHPIHPFSPLYTTFHPFPPILSSTGHAAVLHQSAAGRLSGMLQYFIGVQLDASQYVDPSIHGLQEKLATEGEKIVSAALPCTSSHSQYVDPSIHGLQEKLATEGKKIEKLATEGEKIEKLAIEGEKIVSAACCQDICQTVLEAANNVEGAVRELADPGAAAGDLWAVHTAPVAMKPHKTGDPAWQAIQEFAMKAMDKEVMVMMDCPPLPMLAPLSPLVHLVELRDTNRLFAMKAMDKEVMVNRNKVHRACTERDILGRIDFPFLPTLYASFQTATHVCLITEFCAGGELYGILEKQKGKRLPEAAARFFVAEGKCLPEAAARFFVAEVLLALEYLHCHALGRFFVAEVLLALEYLHCH